MTAAAYTADEILSVLDSCAEAYNFPMLDNGYVYPVDARMALFRDPKRWAVLIETLGYDVRAQEIANAVYCFGNCLRRQDTEADYVTAEAFRAYVESHPFDELVFLHPVDRGPSAELYADEQGQEPDLHTAVNPYATDVRIRDIEVPIPCDPDAYRSRGIELSDPPHVQVYELARYLVFDHRDRLFATDEELRGVVPADVPMMLRLNDWRHPDIADGELPSQTQAFRNLAEVLESGDVTPYRPTEPASTHWRHWPMGGTL